MAKRLTPEEELSRVLAMYEIERAKMSDGYKLICGVDEAGRGPLAGPVYATAVILPPDFFIPKLNDSKKLTEKRREELYDIITENAIAWAVASVDEKRIDEINILNATFEAMNKAISSLSPVPDYVLIDGNRMRGLSLPHETIIGGDAKSASIAAASILAKVSRDRFIIEAAKKYPQYGFEKHKGYGTAAHNQAILQYGPCEIHRRTFLKKLLG